MIESLRRRRRSSPSIRQIALVVVSGGLAIMIIRVAARKAKGHAGSAEVTASQADGQAETTDDAQGATDDNEPEASAEPATGNDTFAGERTLTNRVQREMFRRADAPAQAGGSD